MQILIEKLMILACKIDSNQMTFVMMIAVLDFAIIIPIIFIILGAVIFF